MTRIKRPPAKAPPQAPASPDPVPEGAAVPPILTRMASIASTASPDALRAFEPSSTHRALVGALIEAQPESLVDLATKAGVVPSTLYRTLENPVAVAWIVAEAARVVKVGLAGVYGRLFHMAMTSRKSSWLELFLKRFDPDYRDGKGASLTLKSGDQEAKFENWTTAELEAFVKHKRQFVLGERDGQPAQS